ncbi:MAG: transporter substrate-binding domain-containing protein [Streptosporangiales bacterium]|nr:transporter substrate-binding domain-containing protein [Streptosporangiales bacterium]
MRRRLPRPLILCAAAGVTAAACASSPTSPTAGGAASGITTVHLATVQNMMHTPEFVASSRGIYVKHGLDVKLDILAGGSDVGKAMQAGTAQFGGAGSSAVPTQRTSGLKVRYVAPVLNDATTDTYAGPLGIVGRKDRGLRADDPASLSGKRVGVQRGSTNHDYVLFLLAQEGIDVDSVEFVPITTTDHPVSLKQGDVDAVASWEPFVTQAISDLGPNAAVVSRAEPTLGYVVGAVALDEYIASDADVVRRFAEATAEASHWTRAHPNEAARVATDYIGGLKPDIAREAMNHLSFDPRLSKCTERAVHQTGVDLVKAGEIESTPEAAEMVDPKVMAAVEKAHPEWFADLKPLPERCRY